MSRYALIGLLVGFFVVAACGDDDSNPQDAAVVQDAAPGDVETPDASSVDGGGSSDVLEEVAQSYAYAFCHVGTKCGLVFRGAAGTTVPLDKCEQMVMDRWSGRWRAVVEDAVARGTVILDEAKAHECAQAIRALDCPGFLGGTIPACDEMFQPTVQVGGECHFDGECISGYCEMPDESSCPGQCAELPGQGEDCSAVRQCQGDLVCMDDGTGNRVCMPRKGEGESCTSQSQCLPELYCDTDTGTCRQRKGQGETCSDFDECEYGLFCRGGTCQAVQVVDREGETCSPYEGILCDYDAGLTCAVVSGNVLQCVHWGHEGDSCESSSFCDLFEELYCNPASHTCVVQKGAGEACNDAYECVSEYCDPENGTCAYEECL